MNVLRCAGLALVLALPAWSARADESLRCNDHFVEVGDSRLSVLYKCGPPLLQDSYCAPVYYDRSLLPVPEPFARTIVPCLVVEEWIYDRGPGNLVATVRLRSGVVQSVSYGRSPR